MPSKNTPQRHREHRGCTENSQDKKLIVQSLFWLQFDSHAAEPTTSSSRAKAPKSARPQCRTCDETDCWSSLLSFSQAMFVYACISSRRKWTGTWKRL